MSEASEWIFPRKRGSRDYLIDSHSGGGLGANWGGHIEIKQIKHRKINKSKKNRKLYKRINVSTVLYMAELSTMLHCHKINPKYLRPAWTTQTAISKQNKPQISTEPKIMK